jgi:hypothetical protein
VKASAIGTMLSSAIGTPIMLLGGFAHVLPVFWFGAAVMLLAVACVARLLWFERAEAVRALNN